MSTQELTSTNTVQALLVTFEKCQYTLWQILGIWVSTALPIGLIYWAIMPTLSTNLTVEPGFVFNVLITLGMVWQGVLAYVILRLEVKPCTWENLKARLWSYTPSPPRTGTHSKWLYLWTTPLIAFMNLPGLGRLNDLWIQSFPFLAPPPFRKVVLARQPHSVLGISPAFLLEHSDTAAQKLDLAWFTKRFRSYWMRAIVHRSDALFVTFLFVAVIMDLV